MNTMSRYVLRQQINGCLLALGCLLLLFVVIGLLGELDSAEGRYGFPQMLQFIGMMSPRWAYELLPAAALLGSLLALGGLASGSELIAMRAAGLTVWKLVKITLTGGLFLVMLGLALGEGLAPPLERMARDMKASAQAGSIGASVASGVWIRENDAFVRINRLEGPELMHGVEIYKLDDKRHLTLSERAEWARFNRDSGWQLEDIKSSAISDSAVSASTEGKRAWANGLKPGLLDLFIIRPDSLSTMELLDYTNFLERNQLDTRAYAAALWERIGMPLAVLAMALIALPFVLGSLRDGGTGQRMLIGVILGFVFFLGRQILNRLGVVYGIEPMISGLLPALLMLTIAAIAIRRRL